MRATTKVLLTVLIATLFLNVLPHVHATNIFTDGFEDDFTPWTGTYGSPTTQSTVRHHGTSAMLSDTSNNVYAYKDYTSGTPRYNRMYVQVDAYPTDGHKVSVLAIYDSGLTNFLRIETCNNGGTYAWQVVGHTGGTYGTYTLTTTWLINTWYSVELKHENNVAANGDILYINGSNVWQQTSNAWSAARIYVGGWDKTDSVNTYVDCVAVADAYIGPDAAANTAPTNDSLQLDLTGASYKGTKTLLTGKQDYKFVLKCSDADGVTDISYAEIRLDYATKNVTLRATRGTGDAWAFSEQSDPSNCVTLNVAGSSHSTSGNQKTFNFLVTINWNWDDASETLGVRAYVIDSVSASDQDDYTNVFGAENDLSAYAPSVNDYRVNPSQLVYFFGYCYYEGTSIPPPNGDYQVKIKLAGVQKGTTDTTLDNGYFRINDVPAESTLGSYSYKVEATYMASAGSFPAVIVDGLKVYSYSIDMASSKVYAQMKYGYNDAHVSGGNVSLAGRQASTNSTGWAAFDMTTGGDFSWGQTAYGVQDASYGITYKAQNQTLPIAKKTCFIQSDAQASSLAWDGVKLTVVFTALTGSYTLKVSGSWPVYILNATYDLSTDYGSYLTLSHDGSRSIMVAYPTWGAFYIRSLSSGVFTSVYWSDQKLTLALNGTSGTSGTLTVYCGDRGAPQAVSGFSATPEYGSTTKILSGTYQFANTVTLTLDWTTGGGGTGGGVVTGGGGGTPVITFAIGATAFEVAQGSTIDVQIQVTWEGVNQLTVTSVHFEGDMGRWLTLAEALPKTLTKPIGERSGSSTIAARATVPTSVQTGQYIVPVTMDIEAVGGRGTTNSYVNFTVSRLTSPIPDYMTLVFAILFAAIVLTAYLRH